MGSIPRLTRERGLTMTTEERLAKVERELAETKAQATRAKRRSRWLLVALALGLGALALVWALGAGLPRAEAQGAGAAPSVNQTAETGRRVAETRRRLSEEIDLDFEKTSLDNVLKYIGEVQRGLNIVIDPDVGAAGIDLSSRVVDLRVKRVSVESVLDTILGADLGYKVEAGYILVTTREKLQQKLSAVNEVRAKKFVLVDENGKTRALLALITDGPALVLFDENGEIRADLAVSMSKAGPALLGLYDTNG